MNPNVAAQDIPVVPETGVDTQNISAFLTTPRFSVEQVMQMQAHLDDVTNLLKYALHTLGGNMAIPGDSDFIPDNWGVGITAEHFPMEGAESTPLALKVVLEPVASATEVPTDTPTEAASEAAEPAPEVQTGG